MEGCEMQVCHRIICKDYERKKCIHEGKERFKDYERKKCVHEGKERFKDYGRRKCFHEGKREVQGL